VYRYDVQGKKKIDAVKNKVKMIKIFRISDAAPNAPSRKNPAIKKAAHKKSPASGGF